MNDSIIKAVVAALLLLAAAGVVFLLRKCLSGKAKAILLGLVAEAEARFGAGTGAIKLSAVLGELYARMPALLQLLFPTETVDGWVESALAAFKGMIGKEKDHDGT